mmetsp:Transcript_19066/g.72867  ORF Transcript_19066/g.72867 Transcript_19066/m.72867 type:complete len:239 (+) Transcript_19066:1496-2212(+)
MPAAAPTKPRRGKHRHRAAQKRDSAHFRSLVGRRVRHRHGTKPNRQGSARRGLSQPRRISGPLPRLAPLVLQRQHYLHLLQRAEAGRDGGAVRCGAGAFFVVGFAAAAASAAAAGTAVVAVAAVAAAAAAAGRHAGHPNCCGAVGVATHRNLRRPAHAKPACESMPQHSDSRGSSARQGHYQSFPQAPATTASHGCRGRRSVRSKQLRSRHSPIGRNRHALNRPKDVSTTEASCARRD